MRNFLIVRPERAGAALVAVLVLCPPGYAQESGQYVSPWKTPWEYEGPRGADHWSELDPAYAACNRGKAQSPIEIRHTEKAKLPALRFEYRSQPLGYVINNGHTIRVNYPAGGAKDSYLVVGDTRYRLTQFHFHHPSEEIVRGTRYDMVLHLMHESAGGQVAGVAVMLRTGRANAVVEQLWGHMPAREGQIAVPGVELDPGGMLPSQRGYYRYEGSQTAPPCNEGITWFVLKRPVEVSAQQIEKFAQLYPNDVRPAQPLNGRVVMESE